MAKRLTPNTVAELVEGCSSVAPEPVSFDKLRMRMKGGGIVDQPRRG